MKITYIIFCLCFLVSCHSGEHKNKNEIRQNNVDLSLIFYPSNSIEDKRYSICIINDSLIVNDYSVGRDINDKKEYRGKISIMQNKEIMKRISFIKKHSKNKDDFILGGWGCKLIINHKVIYEDNSFSTNEMPKEIKSLINYLIQISPISINLYSLS